MLEDRDFGRLFLIIIICIGILAGLFNIAKVSTENSSQNACKTFSEMCPAITFRVFKNHGCMAQLPSGNWIPGYYVKDLLLDIDWDLQE